MLCSYNFAAVRESEVPKHVLSTGMETVGAEQVKPEVNVCLSLRSNAQIRRHILM